MNILGSIGALLGDVIKNDLPGLESEMQKYIKC